MYTPFNVCQLMAQIGFDKDNVQKIVDGGKQVLFSEPACGSGAIILAYAMCMKQAGFNPEADMRFVATDLSRKAFYLCYIQMRLAGLHGIVQQGNTLTQKITEEWWS